MRILKFKASGVSSNATILVPGNDTILGLACSILSALKLNEEDYFELTIGNETFQSDNKKIGTKLKNWKFADKLNLNLKIAKEDILINYIDSEFVPNNEIFNYPKVCNADETIRGMAFEVYFHATYWDLKFKFGKKIRQKFQAKDKAF